MLTGCYRHFLTNVNYIILVKNLIKVQIFLCLMAAKESLNLSFEFETVSK